MTKTLKEDMADNDGIRAAFYAYKNQEKDGKTMPGFEHFTDDQLFFINYGVVSSTPSVHF